MSESKRKFNPWIATVIMGVITILFSMFAFQQQSEMIEARKEIEQLKRDLVTAQQRAEVAEKTLTAEKLKLEQAIIDAQIAKEVAESAASKSNKRK